MQNNILISIIIIIIVDVITIIIFFHIFFNWSNTNYQVQIVKENLLSMKILLLLFVFNCNVPWIQSWHHKIILLEGFMVTYVLTYI